MGHTGSGDVIKPGATTFDYIGDAVAKGAGLLVAMCPWGFCQASGFVYCMFCKRCKQFNALHASVS
jgi:hypothetical protein